MNALVLALALTLGPADAADVPMRYAEIERLVLAGNTGEARERLAQASLPDDARLRLEGLLALHEDRPEDAARAFSEALERHPDDTTLRLHLARARLEHGDPARALSALRGTEALARTRVVQPLLHAHALLGLGRDDEAYAVLVRAAGHFPTELAPRLELMALAAREDLRAAARGWAEAVLALGPTLDRSVALAILQALHRDPEALALLEDVAARLPSDPEIAAHLAHAYAAAGRPHVAATLFERATLLGGDHAFEAADQHRLAGHTARALTMNARVRVPARQLEQRLEILFGAGDMARVVALAPQLSRAGLDHPRHLVRLAYAHYVLGQHARATVLAERLLSTDEAERARSLLSAMGRRVATP